MSHPWPCPRQGAPETLEFRCFLKDKNGTVVSPWHDIPLYAGAKAVNFVCEIPKETAAKMEVATVSQRCAALRG